MKILIVDDNKHLAQRIHERLAPHYVTDIVTSAREALVRLEANSYGVILLDLNLPDMSGLEVCQILRSRSVTTPIIILTADDAVKTRVTLLDAGADDFLVKPFNSEELRARIGAVLRRPVTEGDESDGLRVGALLLDTERRQVFCRGEQISLTRKEYDILEYLLRNKGRIRTRAQIFGYAWDGDSDSLSSAVDVHIKHLRDKLGFSEDDAIIHTVHGIGYLVDDPKVVKLREGTL